MKTTLLSGLHVGYLSAKLNAQKFQCSNLEYCIKIAFTNDGVLYGELWENEGIKNYKSELDRLKRRYRFAKKMDSDKSEMLLLKMSQLHRGNTNRRDK